MVEILRAEGVRYVFGMVGSAFLEIMDAMYGLEDLKFVGTRIPLLRQPLHPKGHPNNPG